MDFDSIGRHAATIVGIIQAAGIIVPACIALWAWLKALRAQGLRELVPSVVALVQDAKAQSWAADGKPLQDVAGLVAKNLQALARTRGLGELTPTEVEHGTALAAAEHKAIKLAEVGYTGVPVKDSVGEGPQLIAGADPKP